MAHATEIRPPRSISIRPMFGASEGVRRNAHCNCEPASPPPPPLQPSLSPHPPCRRMHQPACAIFAARVRTTSVATLERSRARGLAPARRYLQRDVALEEPLQKRLAPALACAAHHPRVRRRRPEGAGHQRGRGPSLVRPQRRRGGRRHVVRGRRPLPPAPPLGPLSPAPPAAQAPHPPPRRRSRVPPPRPSGAVAGAPPGSAGAAGALARSRCLPRGLPLLNE